MEEIKKTISRRDALKVLGATGAGLAGALLVPGKWEKPVTQMGVLPAHAQASVCTAVLTLADEGFCEEFPDLACGEFDYFGEWTYEPTNLAPQSVTFAIGGVVFPSDVLAGDSGTLYVLVNSADLDNEGERVITVTFEGGCTGVWTSGPIEVRKPGRFSSSFKS